MKSSKSLKPPESSAGDLVYALILISSAGASYLSSLLGLPLPDLSNAITQIIKSPYQKRTEKFLQEVAEALNKLNASADDLKNNAAFVTALLDMLEASTLTEDVELIGYYRNVVLNTTQPNPPDEDMQRIFRQLTRRFGSWHFKLLTFFSEEKWYVELGFPDDLDDLKPEEALARLPRKFKELETKATFVNFVVNELSDARLIVLPEVRLDNQSSLLLVESKVSPNIFSDLGQQFIDFVIHSPLDIPPHLRISYRR